MSKESDRIASLERENAALTEQLAHAMRELDAFAYAVSHDLRAPLRSLSGFSQALLEGSEIDAGKTRHYLERIQQASRKLSELIDALLSLSRVSRAELHARPIDLSQICSEALVTVAAKYPGRDVRVQIAPALSAIGDPRLVRTALESLFDNAYKFTSLQAMPTITVGKSESGEFYIADNGIGFDPAYAEKLFNPFQRLHADPHFTGIGIGLATVQRIFARHGGRIRVVGKLNGGATAFFSLPSQSSPVNQV